MNVDYLKTPSGILKIVEIVLVVIMFGIERGEGVGAFGDNISYARNNFFFGTGVSVAALIVTPLLLAVYLSGKMEIQGSFFEPVLNVFFAASFFIYGVLAVIFFQTYSYAAGLAMASFSLMAGACYGVDTFFAVKAYLSQSS